jgi:hypothetical protein
VPSHSKFLRALTFQSLKDEATFSAVSIMVTTYTWALTFENLCSTATAHAQHALDAQEKATMETKTTLVALKSTAEEAQIPKITLLFDFAFV